MNEWKPLIGLTLVIGLIVFGELVLGILWWEKWLVDHIIARCPDRAPGHYPDFSAAQADFAAELACLQEI